MRLHAGGKRGIKTLVYILHGWWQETCWINQHWAPEL